MERRLTRPFLRAGSAGSWHARPGTGHLAPPANRTTAHGGAVPGMKAPASSKTSRYQMCGQAPGGDRHSGGRAAVPFRWSAQAQDQDPHPRATALRPAGGRHRRGIVMLQSPSPSRSAARRPPPVEAAPGGAGKAVGRAFHLAAPITSLGSFRGLAQPGDGDAARF